jgi:hypothetical protein
MHYFCFVYPLHKKARKKLFGYLFIRDVSTYYYFTQDETVFFYFGAFADLFFGKGPGLEKKTMDYNNCIGNAVNILLGCKNIT